MEKSCVVDSCRTCLKRSSGMRPMSSQWNQQLKFWEMLVYVTGSTDDLLHNVPENICIQCQNGLSISYSFKKMCLESKDMLGKAQQNLVEEENTVAAIACNQSMVASDNQCISSPEFDHIVFPECSKAPDFDFVDQLPSAKDEEYPDLVASTTVKFVKNTIENTVADHETANTDDEDEIVEMETPHVQKKRPRSSTQRHCLMCQINFDDNKAYQKHHRNVHWPRTVCSECGKLVSKFDMNRHMRAHSHPNEHLCTECGKSFTRSENLKAHMRIHTGDKRYSCEHCGEQFIHWNSKRSHIRAVHTGEMKYECNICSKRFAQISNMRRHFRLHTGEKPHACSVCGKRFMSALEVRNHLVVHTKEKNEHCTVCLKSFGNRRALHIHQKIHKDERNYMCPVCSRTYTQPHVLRTHMKRHPEYPIPPANTVLSQKAIKRLEIKK